jgi:4-hydroxy-tetrahydrodipicolinate synthase
MAALERFGGIYPALATPLHEDETIDEVGYRRLLRRVLDAGVHGVVVLGSAGEFTALADDQKQRAIQIVVSEVAGQVPVIAGTGEPGTRRAVAMTRRAAQLGADAAMVVPPFYNMLSNAGVVTHYRALAEAGDLPIVLYNIPGCTKIAIDLEVARALADEPAIIGIKDSGGNFGYFQSLVQQLPAGFTVVTGSDNLLYASLLVGGSGSIGPSANVAPEWFVGLWNAVKEGRTEEAWEIERRIFALTAIYRHGGFHPALKGALSCLGICKPVVAAPQSAVDEAQLQAIGDILEEVGLR